MLMFKALMFNKCIECRKKGRMIIMAMKEISPLMPICNCGLN